MRLHLGTGDLRCRDVAAIARTPVDVAWGEGAAQRITDSHAAAVALTETREVYGRTTGVGANKDQSVEDPEHGYRLLASHATAAGEARAAGRARATAAVRANQLGCGRAGVSPAVADGLLAMIAADACPLIREGGAVGTGDLAALAALAEYVGGRRVDAAGRPNPAPVPIGIHDALPLLSSGAATLADACLALDELDRLLDAAAHAAALVSLAAGASDEAFSPPVVTSLSGLSGLPGSRIGEVAGRIADIRAAAAGGDDRALVRVIQAPYAVRCIPQVIGAARSTLDRAVEVVETYLNAGLENPLIVVGATPQVAHHGGFYAIEVALALDTVALAIAAVAAQSADRTGLMLDPSVTGLPPFLGDGMPAASGAMLTEYVAAEQVAQLRVLAAPATLQSAQLSHGAEESAPHASLAARQLLTGADALRRVLACEVVTVVRALRMLGWHSALRAEPVDIPLIRGLDALPSDLSDRDLGADLAAAEALLG